MSSSIDQANGTTLQSASTTPAAPGSDYQCRATQLTPRFKLLIDGEPVFLNIEFQKYKYNGEQRFGLRVGRIAILNSVGDTVLDVYAFNPREAGIEKRRQPVEFGVITEDLLIVNGAKPAATVEAWVARIVKNRIVVMHGSTNDLKAFYYQQDIWATSTVVDTQHLYGQINLPKLAKDYLGKTVQGGIHSPVEDADATRLLYLRLRPYDRAAELAKIEAERAVAPETPSPKQTIGTTTTTETTTTTNTQPQNPKKTQASGNLNGSAKRRNRKKAAAEAKKNASQ